MTHLPSGKHGLSVVVTVFIANVDNATMQRGNPQTNAGYGDAFASLDLQSRSHLNDSTYLGWCSERVNPPYRAGPFVLKSA